MKEKNENCKPFSYDKLLCQGCERKYHTPYNGGKWFCFGVTTTESRQAHNIPRFDKLRLCVKHAPSTKELTVRNLFLLNLNEKDVKELINGFSLLLGADRVVLSKEKKE